MLDFDQIELVLARYWGLRHIGLRPAYAWRAAMRVIR